jgi:hypothetical protein
MYYETDDKLDEWERRVSELSRQGGTMPIRKTPKRVAKGSRKRIAAQGIDDLPFEFLGEVVDQYIEVGNLTPETWAKVEQAGISRKEMKDSLDTCRPIAEWVAGQIRKAKLRGDVTVELELVYED